MRHITSCNNLNNALLEPLFAGKICIALMHSCMKTHLMNLPQSFGKTAEGWRFTESCNSATQRTEALSHLTSSLIASGDIPSARNEDYPVITEWGQPEIARIDRSAVVPLGIPAFGVHVNGYVRKHDGIHMWIGRRAQDKAVAPGKLDNMVAGGQPAGLSLLENVIKESQEEASLPPEISSQAKPCNMLRYGFTQIDGPAVGHKFDTLFCYDLELPEDVIPTPGDDECEGFSLIPLQQVLQIIAETDDFKFNVPLVILDFAIRHGILTPDNTANYADLVNGLHTPFPHQGLTYSR